MDIMRMGSQVFGSVKGFVCQNPVSTAVGIFGTVVALQKGMKKHDTRVESGHKTNSSVSSHKSERYPSRALLPLALTCLTIGALALTRPYPIPYIGTIR